MPYDAAVTTSFGQPKTENTANSSSSWRGQCGGKQSLRRIAPTLLLVRVLLSLIVQNFILKVVTFSYNRRLQTVTDGRIVVTGHKLQAAAIMKGLVDCGRWKPVRWQEISRTTLDECTRRRGRDLVILSAEGLVSELVWQRNVRVSALKRYVHSGSRIGQKNYYVSARKRDQLLELPTFCHLFHSLLWRCET